MAIGNLAARVVAVASCLFVCSGMPAQMSVHAVAGQVKAVSAGGLDVQVMPGAVSHFSLPAKAQATDFPSDLQGESTPAREFHKVGDYMLVFFYGFGNQRTAVAVKDLGAGPYTKVAGTVEDFDKHARKVKVRDDSGKETDYVLADRLIVDSDLGATNGRRYSPHKGDALLLTCSGGDAPGTVAFLRPRE